jgi:hypothetical protein
MDTNLLTRRADLPYQEAAYLVEYVSTSLPPEDCLCNLA